MKELPNPVETTFQTCLADVQAKVKTSKARIETLMSEANKSQEQMREFLAQRESELIKLQVLTTMEKAINDGQKFIVADATAKLSTQTVKA